MRHVSSIFEYSEVFEPSWPFLLGESMHQLGAGPDPNWLRFKNLFEHPGNFRKFDL